MAAKTNAALPLNLESGQIVMLYGTGPTEQNIKAQIAASLNARAGMGYHKEAVQAWTTAALYLLETLEPPKAAMIRQKREMQRQVYDRQQKSKRR